MTPGKSIEASGQDPKGLDAEGTKAAVGRQADAPNTLVTPSLLSDSREAIARAVHRGRFPADRVPSPFEMEDARGKEYCFRIADQVRALSLPQTGVEAGVYESAVKGRQDFRLALREARSILTPEEWAAVRELGAEQELSDSAVLRQALRAYQMDHARRKAGETVHWSGDEQRARDFAGPLALTPKVIDRDIEGELRDLAHQYRNDLLYPPAADSRERRIAAIDAVIAKAGDVA